MEAGETQQMDVTHDMTLVIGETVHHCGLGPQFCSATQQFGLAQECSLQTRQEANAFKADGRTDYVC